MYWLPKQVKKCKCRFQFIRMTGWNKFEIMVSKIGIVNKSPLHLSMELFVALKLTFWEARGISLSLKFYYTQLLKLKIPQKLFYMRSSFWCFCCKSSICSVSRWGQLKWIEKITKSKSFILERIISIRRRIGLPHHIFGQSLKEEGDNSDEVCKSASKMKGFRKVNYFSGWRARPFDRHLPYEGSLSTFAHILLHHL